MAGVVESLLVALRHGYYFNTLESLLSFLFVPAAAYAAAGIVMGAALFVALVTFAGRAAPHTRCDVPRGDARRRSETALRLSAALCAPSLLVLFWGSALRGRFFGTIGNAAGHVAMVALAVLAFLFVRRFLSSKRRVSPRPLALATVALLLVGVIVAIVTLPHGSPDANSVDTADKADDAGHATGSSVSVRPSILLVTIDTLRADRTGYSGYRPASDPCADGLGTTPRLDALAARGVTFTNAIVPEVVTDPSHASLLTAVPPWEHGVVRNAMPLRVNVPVLAERLSGAGYTTAAFVSVEHLDGHISHISRGFHLFGDRGSEDRYRHHVGGRILERHARSMFSHERDAAATAAEASRWIDSRGRSSSGDDPFFLWVHIFDPHMPYTNHETGRVFGFAERDAYAVGFAAGATDGGAVKPAAANGGSSATGGNNAGEEGSLGMIAEAAYDSEVRFADSALGALLDALDGAGLSEQTIVVVTADHGEHMREAHVAPESWFGHVDVYDEVCRVPLVMAGPNVAWGRTLDRQISSMDVAPTVLALAGVDATLGRMRGFADEIDVVDGEGAGEGDRGTTGQATGSRPVAGTESTRGVSEPLVVMANPHRGLHDRAVRRGRWKLIERNGYPAELYDLSIDPQELVNVIQPLAPVFAELAAVLAQTPAMFGNAGPGGSFGTAEELDPALREMLEALGYVE